MPKKVKELGALEVGRLTEPGFFPVGGVTGLALNVTPTGGRSWILRFSVGGRRREMGLGGFPDVTLAGAREKARAARALGETGTDPVDARRATLSRLKVAQAAALTFRQCAERYIEGHTSGWTNPKHAAQWTATLNKWAHPILGDVLVGEVSTALVLRVLEQPADAKVKDSPRLWEGKTETASRVRGRMESILDWAKGRGLRTGDNPAAWKGNLDALLPAPQKVTTVVHHEAVAVADVGAFMVKLRAAEGMGARALEFVSLTAARSGEVRGATWAEIDLDAKIWTVPADRMKMKREHRVPLSADALALLKVLPRMAGTDLVFPAPRGGVLSDMTLTAVMRRMDLGAVPHGFRSTFRDWSSERTAYQTEVCEMALAHAVGNAVEKAYRRGDLFEKRRRLMDDWAAFLARVETKGEVIALKGPRAA